MAVNGIGEFTVKNNIIAKMKQFFENPYWIYPLSRVFWKYWWCKVINHNYYTVHDYDIDTKKPFSFKECFQCYHHKDKRLLCESVQHRGKKRPYAKRYLKPAHADMGEVYQYCAGCATIFGRALSPIVDELEIYDNMLVITKNTNFYHVLMKEIMGIYRKNHNTYAIGNMEIHLVRDRRDFNGWDREKTKGRGIQA